MSQNTNFRTDLDKWEEWSSQEKIDAVEDAISKNPYIIEWVANDHGDWNFEEENFTEYRTEDGGKVVLKTQGNDSYLQGELSGTVKILNQTKKTTYRLTHKGMGIEVEVNDREITSKYVNELPTEMLDAFGQMIYREHLRNNMDVIPYC